MEAGENITQGLIPGPVLFNTIIIKFSCSTKLVCAVDFLKKWGIEEGSTQIGALGNS